MAAGISKLDLTKPANTPKIKNKIAGSNIALMGTPLNGILGKRDHCVKSILMSLYIDKNL
jgi:hypothetical protein